MEFREVMATLEEMGTAQNRKTYARHGARDPMYGVSFANLKKLQKKIKMDHRLFEQLWATGNTDARTLALMIVDPSQLTSARADTYLRELDYHLLVGMLASAVSRSKHARAKMKKWTKAKKETTRQCGFDVLSHLLKEDVESIDDDECRGYLEQIEKDIHGSPNRARYAMNAALIAIGSFKPNLFDESIETARRIGTVEVDHGETNCKTPDAESYIRKTVAHYKKNPKAKKRVRGC